MFLRKLSLGWGLGLVMFCLLWFGGFLWLMLVWVGIAGTLGRSSRDRGLDVLLFHQQLRSHHQDQSKPSNKPQKLDKPNEKDKPTQTPLKPSQSNTEHPFPNPTLLPLHSSQVSRCVCTTWHAPIRRKTSERCREGLAGWGHVWGVGCFFFGLYG